MLEFVLQDYTPEHVNIQRKKTNCEFCEICKNTFFAAHHRTAASYYSSISGNEGRIGNETVNYDTKLKHMYQFEPEV